MEQPIIGAFVKTNIYFNDLTLDAINDPTNGETLISHFMSNVLKPFLKKQN